MIANSRVHRHAPRTRKDATFPWFSFGTAGNASSACQDVTIGDLLGIVIAPALRWWRRQVLRARLRSLQGLADYFEWQEANGREGIAGGRYWLFRLRSSVDHLPTNTQFNLLDQFSASTCMLNMQQQRFDDRGHFHDEARIGYGVELPDPARRHRELRRRRA